MLDTLKSRAQHAFGNKDERGPEHSHAHSWDVHLGDAVMRCRVEFGLSLSTWGTVFERFQPVAFLKLKLNTLQTLA